MEKIRLGELWNYLPEELLLKTNIFDFLTQEIIDDFNKVLSTKNPDHRENHKRQWDYAYFETKRGNSFCTQSIFDAAFVNPEFDELFTTIWFKNNNVEYWLRTFVNSKQKFILMGDVNETNALKYEVKNGEVKTKEARGVFRFVELEGEGEQG